MRELRDQRENLISSAARQRNLMEPKKKEPVVIEIKEGIGLKELKDILRPQLWNPKRD